MGDVTVLTHTLESANLERDDEKGKKKNKKRKECNR
jgi:hypothetical protein